MSFGAVHLAFHPCSKLQGIQAKANKESWPKGPGFGLPQRGFALLKFQITNPKKQTNNNDQNSKSQTKKQSLTRRKRLRCAG
jgi:hypothetical protein